MTSKGSVMTNDSSISSDDNASTAGGGAAAAAGGTASRREKSKRKVFQFTGAAIPSETTHNLWHFYDPRPTVVERPDASSITNEDERNEWNQFFDKVDEILVPVNKSRRFVFFFTCISLLIVATLVIGLFTFAKELWMSDSMPRLMALYIVLGFSIIPVTLLITIKCGVPSRVHEMEKRIKLFCEEEETRKTEKGPGIWKIRFNDRGEKGYQIVVKISEVSNNNNDNAQDAV